LHGSLHPLPDINSLYFSPISLLYIHTRSQGFPDLRSWSDTLSFFTPGRSAPAITSSSCSRTSTRNPLHRAGSIRSVTPPQRSNLPPEDASGNIFSGSALMFFYLAPHSVEWIPSPRPIHPSIPDMPGISTERITAS
jgi:hypothetical protein